MPFARPTLRLFDDRSPYLDRFGLLLLVTTASVITQSVIDLDPAAPNWRSVVGALVVTVFVAATMSLAVRAAGVTRPWQRTTDGVVLLGVAASVATVAASAAGDAEPGLVTPAAPLVLLSVLAPVLVVRRVLQHREATSRTLLGAVSAYLLIAVTFAFAFQVVQAVAGTPFFGDDEPTTSFMYFSLVTITTLGYGDLTAATEVGRLAAVLEALIGQVYLITFVALVVGLLVNRRGSLTRNDRGRRDEEGRPPA